MSYLKKIKDNLAEDSEIIKENLAKQTGIIKNNLAGKTENIKEHLDAQKEKLKENIQEGKEKRRKEEIPKPKKTNNDNKGFLLKIGLGVIIMFIVIGFIAISEEKEENNKSPIVEDYQASEEEETNSLSKTIYDSAVGKMAYAVFKDLEKENFDTKFIHAVTKEDFTISLQSTSPEDEEWYMPWIITELDSFNADEKHASFYINTNENLAREAANQTIKEKLTVRLTPSIAWGTAETYGKDEHPNGFKLKIYNGILAETAQDENTWFLKANCEIKNNFGQWEKYVCEAEVSGTNDNPIVNYFLAY